MAEYLVWIWLAIAIASAILEFVSMQMVSVWFTVGSIVAIILSLCGVAWWIQLLTFGIVSLVLLLALRKLCLKYLLKNDNTTTNVDGMVGTTQKLIEPIIDDKAGAVKISGVVWTAVTADNTSIANGETVVVERVEGNKLIVSKKQKGDK